MFYSREQQEKEIETIRERTITVKLSDADCQRLAEKAAMVGETIDTLMTSFIGDLVNGTYTNGSDEVDCAQSWFERSHSFGYDKTFLSYLIQYGEVGDVIENISNIEDLKKDIEIFKEELKTGQLDSGGTWEDLETHSLGVVRPTYSCKEEWEVEQRDSIKLAENEIQHCETTINDYWEDYVRTYKIANPDMDKEIKHVLEWSEQLDRFKGESPFDAAIDEAIQTAELQEPNIGMEV